MSGKAMTALLAVLSVLCLVAISILWSAGARAQSRCGPRAEIIKMLSDKYKEFLHGTGTINDQAIMEVFISHKGTWTILVTGSGNATCILAAGDAWDDLPSPPELKGQGT